MRKKKKKQIYKMKKRGKEIEIENALSQRRYRSTISHAPDSLVRLQSKQKQEQQQQQHQVKCTYSDACVCFLCFCTDSQIHNFPHNKINCKLIVSLSRWLVRSFALSFIRRSIFHNMLWFFSGDICGFCQNKRKSRKFSKFFSVDLSSTLSQTSIVMV